MRLARPLRIPEDNLRVCPIQGFLLALAHSIHHGVETHMVVYAVQKGDTLDGDASLDMFDLAQDLMISLCPLHIADRSSNALFVGDTGWCAAPAQFACSRYAAVVVPAGVRGGRFLIGVRLQHGCSME